MFKIVKYLWVDCFIDKFAKLYPQIPSFLLYNNRHNVELAIKDGNLSLDFSKINTYFEVLLKKFEVKKILIDISAVSNIKNVLLPCDSFFLPYSVQNYKKFHLEHYILLKDYVQGQYCIFDDNPIFEGLLSENLVNASYEYFNSPIFHYSVPEKILNADESLSLFSATWEIPQCTPAKFIDLLLEEVGRKEKILRIIEESRIPFKRYNSILNCFFDMEKFGFDVSTVIEVGQRYMGELAFISNLASVGLICPEKYIERIIKRMVKLKGLECEFLGEANRVVKTICGATN